MHKKLIAMALLACSVPVAANAAWNFTTWAKNAGGTISSRNNTAQTNLNSKIFKSYTTHESLPATVTAAAGYTISDITLNGASLGAQASPWESALLISGGAFASAPQSLYATFKRAILPVTASTGGNGTVSPTSVSNIYYGTTTAPIVFSFTPATGYKVASITGADSFTVAPAVASATVNQTVKVTIPTGTSLTAAVSLSGTFATTLPGVDAIPVKTVFTNTPITLTGTGVNGLYSKMSLLSSPASANAFATITDVFVSPYNRAYTPNRAGDYKFQYCVADTACTTFIVTATASFGATATTQCLDCHNSNAVGSAANVGGYLNSAHAANNMLCSKCHVGADLGSHPGTVAANICTTCHGVTAPAPPATANHSSGETCYSCHKHNATSNTAVKPFTVSNVVFGTYSSNNSIQVSFTAKSGTTAVTGLVKPSAYLASLVPGVNGASDEWKYWTTTATSTLVAGGTAGDYTLKLTNKRLANADASSTIQRALLTFSQSALYERANVVYDFDKSAIGTPAAFGKDVINDNSCKECHGYGVTIHSFGRNNTQACVVCHSPNYSANMVTNDADMVTLVHQIHNGDGATNGAKATVSGNAYWSGHGDSWGVTNNDPTKLPAKDFMYPGTMLNCAKCHNSVAQADNWKTKPTMIACKSCHGMITFDGTAYAGIKSTTAVPVAGVLHTATDNSACIACHNEAKTAADHVAPVSKNPALRTIQATISSVDVNSSTGAVTVFFSVVENGAPKLNLTSANFILAKLIPAVPGQNKPSEWQSYLSRLRSGTDTLVPIQNFAPVLQANSESATTVGGKLTNIGGGDYSYKFALVNSASYNAVGPVTGSIFDIDRATNGNTAGIYSRTVLPYMSYPVAYEPALTHRVGVNISSNLADASFDFVPSGGTAETRNIVAFGTDGKSCNSCHGASSIHRSTNDLKYCVGCHNANTSDSFTGPTDIAVPATTAPALRGASVTLERIVHKIHMGSFLPSVIAGGSYMIATQPGATTHDYSRLQYPGGVPQLTTDATKTVTRASAGRPADCTKCHDESAPGMTEAANWKISGPACFSCHDTMEVTNHNKGAVCTSCHNGQDVIDFHFGKAQ